MASRTCSICASRTSGSRRAWARRRSTRWPRAGSSACTCRIEDVSPPTLETLDTAVAFIDDALVNPAARVYVHCRAGMERTACVLVAWHARAHGVDYDTALAALRRGRPVLSPLPDQTAVTREWIARNVEGRTT